MDFESENSQNSAPGSVQAAKLGGSRKGPDAQSVTKRYVNGTRKPDTTHDVSYTNDSGLF